MTFILAQRLENIKRLVEFFGPKISENRTDVKEFVKLIKREILLAEQEAERESVVTHAPE